MTETADAERLTLRGAIETLSRLQGLEQGLVYRTEGITWMLWGLVVGGIFTTFHAAGTAFGPDFPFWAQFLWAPWVAAGILATMAIWRSAHLTARVEPARPSWSYALGYTAFFFVLFLAGWAVFLATDRDLALREPGVATLILGFASLIMGFTPVPPKTLTTRRLFRAIGLVTILVMVLLVTLYPFSDAGQAANVQGIVGVLLVGGGWFLSGWYLTTKG